MNVGAFVYMLLQALLLAAAAPLVAGLIKSFKARLQNRRGPKVLQVYYDLFKLLAKDSVVSPTVSWIFAVAPFIYLSAAFAAAALAPFYTTIAAGLPVRFTDLFVLLYLFALGRFFLALASLDSGSAFGGMGGSREMFISTLVEPALLLALLTVAFKGHSTALAEMAAAAPGTPGLAAFFAAIAFFMVLIAETGRIPVDNPDTHLELTMVHEGMVLEYSGRRLGLIVWASAIKQLVMMVLFISLFLPWPAADLPVAGQLVLFVVKLVVCAMALALSETLTNKMRLFKIPGFMAVAGLLALLAIVAQ